MTRSLKALLWAAVAAVALAAAFGGAPAGTAAKPAKKPKPDLVIAGVCRLGAGVPFPDDPRFVSGGRLVVTVANVGHRRAEGAAPFNVGVFTKGSALAQAFVDRLNPNGELTLEFADLTFGPTGTAPNRYRVQVDLAYFADGQFSFPNRVAEADDGRESNEVYFEFYGDLPACDG